MTKLPLPRLFCYLHYISSQPVASHLYVNMPHVRKLKNPLSKTFESMRPPGHIKQDNNTNRGMDKGELQV